MSSRLNPHHERKIVERPGVGERLFEALKHGGEAQGLGRHDRNPCVVRRIHNPPGI